jgi:hypothetical protein
MWTASTIAGSADLGLISCGPAPGMSKVIVSGPCVRFASRIAWRSEPSPLS